MVRRDAADVLEETVDKMLEDGQQVNMKVGSKKGVAEEKAKCPSGKGEKRVRSNDGTKSDRKTKKSTATDPVDGWCNLSQANTEERGKGKLKAKTKRSKSESSAEVPLLVMKRKTGKVTSGDELEEGSGKMQNRNVVGTEAKKSKKQKTQREKKNLEKAVGEKRIEKTDKKGPKKKKVRAGADKEEKRDEGDLGDAANGDTWSQHYKGRAAGNGASMTKEKRKKKMKCMVDTADSGSGHVDTAAREDGFKGIGGEDLKKKRKKKRLPIRETKTGMGTGAEEDKGDEVLTGNQAPLREDGGRAMKTQLRKSNAGGSGRRGKAVKEEKGIKRKTEGKKKSKMEKQVGEGVATIVQEAEEEQERKTKKKRNTPVEADLSAGEVQKAEEQKKKKTKAHAEKSDSAVKVQNAEAIKKKKKSKAQAEEDDTAVVLQDVEEKVKNKKQKRKAQAEEDDTAVVLQEVGEKVKNKKQKRKAQAEEDDTAVVLQEVGEKVKNKKQKRKAQTEEDDTAVIQKATKNPKNNKEKADSVIGEGQPDCQGMVTSKERKKRTAVSNGEKQQKGCIGGGKEKNKNEGNAAWKDDKYGPLNGSNGKLKKKKKNSVRESMPQEDIMLTERRIPSKYYGLLKKEKEEEEEVPVSKSRKQREESPTSEVDVVFLSEKTGNKDEVTIDQERRQALQKEIDNASRPGSSPTLGQWGSAHFDNASQQQKFLRLMGGFKSGNKPTGSAGERANMALGKEGQERLQQNLLMEFERAQNRRLDFQNKGVGLGFSPPPNKKFFIDVDACRSVRFDD